MSTKEMREEAQALLVKAEQTLTDGDVEASTKMIEDAKSTMDKADAIDASASQIKALKGEFNKPTNSVPIASSDLANYDPNDTGANLKASYKPASWVKDANGKDLPASAQPMWVQEKMGVREKEEAKFQTETFVKWLSAPSENAFFKNATPDEMKAMQEDTDAEGGYFVPEEFINQVIHDPGLPSGALRSACTTIRVSSKDGYIPTFASATWGAIAEEGAFSDQTPTVGQVAFSTEKSGGLVKVTRELLDDSAVNLPALLSQIFQEASGRFEDVGILNGNNTANYGGIIQNSSVADYVLANATSITFADLVGVYYTLEAQHRENASYVTTSTVMKAINSIQSTGNGITGVGNITDSPSSFILGKPAILNDVAGNGMGSGLSASSDVGIFGDFKQYYLFDRIGFSIRRNDSLYMGNDQVGFFATRRGDGQVGLAGAFKIMKMAAS